MKSLSLIICLALFATFSSAQQPVSLSSLAQLSPATVGNLQSMSGGIHYATIGANGRTIEQYEYATGKKVADLLNLDKLETKDVASIAGFEINSTSTRILIYTKPQQIYRYSFSADYYVYDLNRRELLPLSDGGNQRMASFSPDGYSVAFVKDNNLYLAKLRFKTVSAVTTDGSVGSILNGVPDWVYEEEFTLTQAYAWSPNSEELAFIRFDESDVKSFNYPLYGGSFPANNQYAQYPGTYSYKYPKTGEANSKVSVRVFNLMNRTTKTMEIGSNPDIYIPRIQWTVDSKNVAVVRLNRLQNQLDFLLCNSASTVSNIIFTHRNEQYISDEVLDNLLVLPDGSGFVYLGEMDGYNHIHYFSMVGTKLAQLTSGKYDVTSILGYDPDKKNIYYQAAEESPLRRDIYMVSMNGKSKKKLSTLPGINDAQLSDSCRFMLLISENSTTPSQYSILDRAGKLQRVVEDNKVLLSTVKEYEIAPREFFSFKQSQGIDLNGWMMKPAGFDASKKYPVLLMQYSGPNSQEVLDDWQIGWEQALVANGIIVVYVDPRGTGARGEAFRKSTYMNLGVIESDDLIDAAKYLGALAYVDASRIGIWGWSYGGFTTLMSMSRSNLFKVGVAIAPVTDWRFYDTAYTERYLRRPSENQAGYNNSSLLQMPAKLSGKLLLVHGTADDNVHFQNTMEYADRLIQAGMQFDMMVYPNQSHSINGGGGRLHLYQKTINYLKDNL